MSVKLSRSGTCRNIYLLKKFFQIRNELNNIVDNVNNEIFRIDPRISTPSKLVDSEFKSYKSKMRFTKSLGKQSFSLFNNHKI
jgi:hypothetical protein